MEGEPALRDARHKTRQLTSQLSAMKEVLGKPAEGGAELQMNARWIYFYFGMEKEGFEMICLLPEGTAAGLWERSLEQEFSRNPGILKFC